MAYLSKLAILSAFASAAIATPTPVDWTTKFNSNGTFSIKQSVKQTVTRNGPKALAAAYTKFKAAVPQEVAAAAASTTGSAVATPESDDEAYLIPVDIGGQTLNLDLDTGSSDLWVFSSQLSASERSGHSYYDPSKSTTAKKLSGYTWSITYGDDSSASGDVYDDKVTVGGVTATTQAVEAAETVSSEFTSDTDTDGLIGLAFSSINTVSPESQLTFFDNVKSSLASELFTADLKKGEPGTYDFGYIDSSKHTGSVTYVSVDDSNGFWGFTASGYGIGTSSTTSKTFTGIADTGTTLLLLPDAIVDAYYAKVSGASYSSSQGGYVFSCSATLPEFVVDIGGYKAVVPGSYINYASVSSSQCYGGIQSDSDIGFSIFGDIFLKSQFVVFENSGTPRLGFAPKTL